MEQRKDRERLRRYISREGLVSLMNDTKWHAAIDALAHVPDWRPRFRVRCLRDTVTQEPTWDYSFPWHVPEFVAIEWLEVDPVGSRHGRTTDFSEDISAALDAVHVPYCVVQGAIRIVGYSRPAASEDAANERSD